MKELLGIIADLKAEDDLFSRGRFTLFKWSILNETKREKKEIIGLLKKLAHHDMTTMHHNLMVARDTDYIAKRLGLSHEIRRLLRIAALVHDVGKLDIHEAILNKIPYNEQVAVWKNNNKGSPKGNLLNQITLRQVIDHKANNSDDPEFKSIILGWIKDKHLVGFLDKPVLEYIQHHAHATERILREYGLDPRIVEYAASHHPSYFDEKRRKKIPKEARIIEIADKFNAIIQSEGIRHYFKRKTKAEAFEIIITELRHEFAEGFWKTFERKALGSLVSRYIPEEVEDELIPLAKRLINRIKANKKILQNDKSTSSEVIRAIAVIAAAIAICNEFRQMLDAGVQIEITKLNTYLDELKTSVGVK